MQRLHFGRRKPSPRVTKAEALRYLLVRVPYVHVTVGRSSAPGTRIWSDHAYVLWENDKRDKWVEERANL